MTDSTRAILSAGMGISELDPIAAQDVWTVKRWDLDWDGNGNRELILAGPGVSGIDDILVGVQCWSNTGSSIYNWMLGGFTGYSAVDDWRQQPGIHSGTQANMVHVGLDNSTMDYWFFGNGRRITGVVKVGGTYYASFYMGYILPYGVPNSFPYPLAIGGSMAWGGSESVMRYSNAGAHNRGWMNPYAVAGTVINPSCLYLNGSWLHVANKSSDAQGQMHYKVNIWPYVYGNYGGASVPDYYMWNMDPNPAGEHHIYPLILYSTQPNINMFGEFQGIFAVPSSGVVTEDTLTIDGDTYIIFQNGRLLSSYEFFAIKKE